MKKNKPKDKRINLLSETARQKNIDEIEPKSAIRMIAFGALINVRVGINNMQPMLAPKRSEKYSLLICLKWSAKTNDTIKPVIKKGMEVMV